MRCEIVSVLRKIEKFMLKNITTEFRFLIFAVDKHFFGKPGKIIQNTIISSFLGSGKNPSQKDYFFKSRRQKSCLGVCGLINYGSLNKLTNYIICFEIFQFCHHATGNKRMKYTVQCKSKLFLLS